MWQETVVPSVGGDQKHHYYQKQADKRDIMQTPGAGDWCVRGEAPWETDKHWKKNRFQARKTGNQKLKEIIKLNAQSSELLRIYSQYVIANLWPIAKESVLAKNPS